MMLEFEKLIPTGKENAVSVSELCNITGMTTRAVRATVSRIRREQHKIICSNN